MSIAGRGGGVHVHRVMPASRREFIHAVAASSTACALAACERRGEPSAPTAPARIAAVAFDAFVIFDPRPISALADALVPGRGAELVGLWRARQFEYAWLRALAGQYADFWHVTEAALVHAAGALQLTLDGPARARLLRAHLELRPWPDVVPALTALADAGVRLALLSNFTPRMLAAAVASAGLTGRFEHLLSTDAARTYKPDPRAYRLGTTTLRLAREQIAFAAFAGWDAVGARWFGYPSVWVNRLGRPVEALGASPDATGVDLGVVVDLVLARR